MGKCCLRCQSDEAHGLVTTDWQLHSLTSAEFVKASQMIGGQTLHAKNYTRRHQRSRVFTRDRKRAEKRLSRMHRDKVTIAYQYKI